MNIILSDGTKIEINSISPDGRGLIIDVAVGKLSEIEPYITNDSIHTITCMEGNTVFARYDNQQLDSLVKDNTGVHINTRYKTIAADADVSKQLSDLQNELLLVQNTQDVQNAAIAEIGVLVSQSLTADAKDYGEEAKKNDTVLCAND